MTEFRMCPPPTSHSCVTEQTHRASPRRLGQSLQPSIDAMTTDKSTTAKQCPAERRGDDTHWWKAYQAHSKATAMSTPLEVSEPQGITHPSVRNQRRVVAAEPLGYLRRVLEERSTFTPSEACRICAKLSS
jgi:hypothetical protein